MKAEQFNDVRVRLAEGPLYHEEEDLVYWVDIEGRKIHYADPKTGQDRFWDTPSRPGMLRFSQDDRLYTGLEDGLYRREKGAFVLDTPMPYQERVRSNDGTCDPAGRLWLGSMELSCKPGAASLYRITRGEVKTMITQVTISNGMCFSPDNRYLYYIDTPCGHLWRYEYDLATGEIANPVPWIDYREEPGNFDGMTMDSQGFLWVAHYGGSQVSVWDPVTGKKEGRLDLPVPNVTCCAFVGENYDTLVVTTAASREPDNLSGGLFVCRDTGAKGLPAFRYRP